jgi:hypothetical protein
VVAFGSKHPNVNVLEVGDAMSLRGWHLNGLSDPPAVHIACTVRLLRFFKSGTTFLILILSLKTKRLTLPVVDAFIADLKDAVREAKVSPSGSGTMVAVYGTSFISIFFSLHFGVGPFASLPHFKFWGPPFALHLISLALLTTIVRVVRGYH